MHSIYGCGCLAAGLEVLGSRDSNGRFTGVQKPLHLLHAQRKGQPVDTVHSVRDR